MLIILKKNGVENDKNEVEINKNDMRRRNNTQSNSKTNSWLDNYRTSQLNILKSDCVGLKFVRQYSKCLHYALN